MYRIAQENLLWKQILIKNLKQLSNNNFWKSFNLTMNVKFENV